MRQEIKKLFDRYEIYMVITAGLLIAMFGLIGIALSHTYSSMALAPSAYQAAMIYTGSAGEIFGFILLYPCVVLPYVDAYYAETRWGLAPSALTRETRFRYFTKKVVTVLLSAFIVIIIPYLLNQLFCCIAYPLNQIKDYYGDSVYNTPFATEILRTPTPGLYMNHPLLLNCMHMGYACLYGGGIALMGYTISLFAHKNKAVVNLLPIAIPLIWTFVGMYMFGTNYAPALAIKVSPTYSVTSLAPALIIIGCIYLFSILGIFIRSFIIKDEII